MDQLRVSQHRASGMNGNEVERSEMGFVSVARSEENKAINILKQYLRATHEHTISSLISFADATAAAAAFDLICSTISSINSQIKDYK